MKRCRPLCFVMALLLLLPGLGRAQTRRYPIADLPAATSPRWHQTYVAHGRTIEVDEEILIPAVSAAPVLLVEKAPQAPEALRRALAEECARALREDPVGEYGFFSSDFRTTLTRATPPGWGENRGCEYDPDTMGWQSHALYAYDPDAAYAQDNPLTVHEAADIVRRGCAELFPDEALHLRNVAAYDRNYWKKNHEPIQPKGHYHLELAQSFHGLPLLASVHSAFTARFVGDEDALLDRRGLLMATVYDESAYSFTCWFYREKAVGEADIPLLPFDAVKGQVEALIESGYVRAIDSVGLGYVQFDTEDRSVQALVPAWVVWCEYQAEGPNAERTGPLYVDGLFQDGSGYRPLILNAQTGELVDPESTVPGRCLCPPVLAF